MISTFSCWNTNIATWAFGKMTVINKQYSLFLLYLLLNLLQKGADTVNKEYMYYKLAYSIQLSEIIAKKKKIFKMYVWYFKMKRAPGMTAILDFDAAQIHFWS